MNYADLQVTTHYSFLRGASSPEELFSVAALLGIKALGIVDRNSLAGMVRCHEAAKVTGIRLLVGCRLDLQCGTSLLVYPTDRAAYGRLCRLLSEGKMRAPKGDCILTLSDLERWQEGLLLVVMPPHPGRKTVEIERPEKSWNQQSPLRPFGPPPPQGGGGREGAGDRHFQ